jgi:hypothetical protein
VNEVGVGCEEFFGAALSEAPIESIDEVERWMSCDELEGSGWSDLGDFHAWLLYTYFIANLL